MKKKVLAGVLALMALMGTTVPAFAEEPTYSVDYTDPITEERSYSVTVVQVKGAQSTFSVTLPKTMSGITVNNAISWDYDVAVSGDIAGMEVVSVVPDEEFVLSQTNKPSITANVTQPINTFRDNGYTGTLLSNEAFMRDGTTGKVTASGISAGEWKGSFYFNVALEDDIASYTVRDLDYMFSAADGEPTEEDYAGVDQSIRDSLGTDEYVIVTLNSSLARVMSVDQISLNMKGVAEPGTGVFVLCDYYEEDCGMWDAIVDDNYIATIYNVE